jgi:hypothetical protein
MVRASACVLLWMVEAQQPPRRDVLDCRASNVNGRRVPRHVMTMECR